MKKAINRWCFPENFSIKKCMILAKEAGFQGIELTLSEDIYDDLDNISKNNNILKKNDIYLTTTSKDLLEISNYAKQVEIEIHSLASSLLWKYPLTSSDSSVQKKGKEIIKKMIDIAKILGAEVVLVVPGVVDDTVSYQEAYLRSLRAFKELKKYAEKEEIIIAIENVWNKFLLSPLEMKNFLQEIGSQYVSLYFDVGNVMRFSYPEYWIDILADYIVRIHVKDFDTKIGNLNGFKNLLQGDVNWENVINSLKLIGYNSYLTAELEPYKALSEQLVYDTAEQLSKILLL